MYAIAEPWSSTIYRQARTVLQAAQLPFDRPLSLCSFECAASTQPPLHQVGADAVGVGLRCVELRASVQGELRPFRPRLLLVLRITCAGISGCYRIGKLASLR
jgi:hypothetical protein